MSGGGDDNEVKDTPEQKHLAEVAAEKWNFAQEKLAPLEDRYMEHVDQMDSEGKMSYIRGRTFQAQGQGLSQAQGQMESGLAQAGINPNSGRFQGEMHGLSQDIAGTGGEMAGRAQFEQDSQQVRGLQNIVAIGQGQSGQAQAGLSRLAQESSSDAIAQSQNAFNRRSANLQLVGQLAGAGTNYGMENNWFGGGQPPQTSGMSVPSEPYSAGLGLDTGSNGYNPMGGGI